MYISSIELRNIGPYQSVRKTFTRGLVGIVGPNGAGKSTLLKSCYAAITGDFSRFRGGRNSAIRLGSPDTEPAYITVTGEHHGHEFTITRGLRRMSRQTLTLGGETYTEAKEVQRAMEDLVGVPMAILENYVFMRQGKLTELFELTDTARAKLFHNLCDTEIAETIWRCLGTRIGVLDKDLRTRTLPDLEGMHARIRELRRQISDAESRMARVESAKLPRERRDLLRDLAQAYAQTAGDPQRRERLLQDREQQQRLLRERADRVEKLRLASENLQALVSEGQRNSLAAREALLAWRTYDQWLSQVQEVQDRIAQRKRDLDACRPPRAPKRATTEGKAEVLREIAAVQARLERAQQLRDLLADQHSVDCQACGAPVHKLVDMRDEAVRDLRELPERLQKLREERDAITAYERERDAHERRVANLQAKLRADEGGLGYLQQKVQAQQAAPLAKVAGNWLDWRTYLRTPYRAVKSRVKSWFGGSAANAPVGDAARAMQRNYGVTPETAQQVLRGTGMPESHAAYIPKGLAGEAEAGTKPWNPKMKHLTDPAAEAAAVRSQFPKQLPPEVEPHAQFGGSLDQGTKALYQQRVQNLAAARPTHAGTLAGGVGGAVLADKALGEEYDARTRLVAATGGALLGGLGGHLAHAALNQRRTKHLLRPGARRREVLEAYRYAPPGHTPDSVLRAQANHPRIARRPSTYELAESAVTGAFGAGLPAAYAYSGLTGKDMDPAVTAVLMAAGGVGLPVARMVWKPRRLPLGATLAGEASLQGLTQYARDVHELGKNRAQDTLAIAEGTAGNVMQQFAASQHPELRQAAKNERANQQLVQLMPALALSGLSPKEVAEKAVFSLYPNASPAAREEAERIIAGQVERLREVGTFQFIAGRPGKLQQHIDERVSSLGLDRGEFLNGMNTLIRSAPESIAAWPDEVLYPVAQSLGLGGPDGEPREAVVERLQQYREQVSPLYLTNQEAVVKENLPPEIKEQPAVEDALMAVVNAWLRGRPLDERSWRALTHGLGQMFSPVGEQTAQGLAKAAQVPLVNAREALHLLWTASPEELQALSSGQALPGAQYSPETQKALKTFIAQMGGDARAARSTYQADVMEQGAANFGEQALGLDPATSAAFGEQFGAIIRNEGTLGQAFLSFSGAINSLPDMLLGTFLPEETLGGMETWQKWAIILGTLLGAGGLLSGTDTGTVLGAIGLLGLLAGLIPSLFGGAVEEQQSDQPPTEQAAAAGPPAPVLPASPSAATPESPESIAALQSRMADPYPVL